MRDAELNAPVNSQFFSVYRAKVTNNTDTKSGGRIQVRIYGIHSQDEQEIPNSTLPWAIPALAPMGGTAQEGFFSIPEVDSIVWIFFDGGNHNLPIYFASAPNKSNWNTSATTTTVIMNLGSKGIKIINSNGGEITMDENGNITIQAEQLDITSDGDMSINSGGSLEINSDGDMEITASGDFSETAGGEHITTARNIEHQ